MDDERAGQGAGAREEGGYLACASCGKLMPASAAFCHVCGSSLKAASPQGVGEAAVSGSESSGAPEIGEARGGETAEPFAPPPSAASSGGGAPPPHPPYPSREAAFGYAAPPPGGMPWSPYGDYPRPYPQAPYLHHTLYPYQAPFRARKTDDLAIISLICALISFIAIPFFPAVAAIALGFASRQRIREANGSLEGEGLALAGIIVGIFNVALCLGLLALVLALATGG